MEQALQNKQTERHWVGRLSNIIQEQSLGGLLPFGILNEEAAEPVSAELHLPVSTSLSILKLCKNDPDNILSFFLSTLNILRYRYTGKEDLVTRVAAPDAENGGEDGRENGRENGGEDRSATTWFSRFRINESETFRSSLTRQAKYRVEDAGYMVRDWGEIIEKLKQNFSIEPDSLSAVGLQCGRYKPSFGREAELLFSYFKQDDNFCLGVVAGRVYIERTILQAIVRHWGCLINSCLTDPDDLLPALRYMPAEELKQIEKYANGPQRDFKKYDNIITPFIEIARRFPDATAVVGEDARISYGRLHEDSDKLSHYLSTELKVKKGDLVGLMMSRKAGMVTAMISILKSGAAFVPIDPALPADRIKYILEDTGLKILLTDDPCRERVPDFTGRVLSVDGFGMEVFGAGETETGYDPGALAYVIYTSGSTGNPKGVMIRHDGFINMLNWYIEEYQFSRADKTLIITSHSFDLTLKNIFGPLWTGGEVHLLKQKDFDPLYINDLIESEEISFINCTPFNFYPLVDAGIDPGFSRKLRSLRVVNLGGEGINVGNLRAWLEADEYAAQFVNTYGCTECSDIASSYTVADHKAYLRKPIPAGSPIPNTSVYVLNENLEPTPIGFTGELFNVGIGVGAGYWNNPGLTDHRFLPDPHRPGSRIYRTGDLVRLTPEGLIEFVERKDHQVKIRGNRVETGEIENKLLQNPDVKRAVVIPRKEEKQYTYLAAYVISAVVLNPRELREFLMRSLPEYMIPDYFIQVDEFPLNENGKLDWKKLPDPTKMAPAAGASVPPGTAMEIKIAGIWQEIFSSDSCGVLDNFFASGGNSFKAVQLAARIGQQLFAKVTISDIFNNPTIRELATLLQPLDEVAAREEIRPVPPSKYYPLSQAQKRIWIEDQLEEGSSIAYNAQVVQEIGFEVDKDCFQQSINALIERHESLRTSFHFIDDEPMQQVHTGFGCTVQYHDVRTARRYYEEARKILWLDSRRPFDLRQYPLMRVNLVSLASEKWCVGLTLHHIICDGWSMNVLLRELEEIYHALARGSRPDLPPLTIQYKDYAAWHNKLLDSDIVRKQKLYWHKKLSGKLAVQSLPLEYRREEGRPAESDRVSFMLSPGAVALQQELSRKNNVSGFIIFSAIIKILIYKITGRRDVIVGGLSFGRDRQVLANLVGTFVNPLVLRDQLSEEDSFLTVLQKVKSTILESSDNKDYPFDWLADELQPNRSRAQGPFFNVLVVYHDFVKEPLDLDEDHFRQDLLYGGDLLKHDVVFAFTGIDKIRCDIFFDKYLFEKLTMKLIKEELAEMFESYLAQPAARVPDPRSVRRNIPVDLEDDFNIK